MFEVITKSSYSAGRRFQIDVCVLGESHTKGKMRRTEQLSGIDNATDVLTKEILSQNSAI